MDPELEAMRQVAEALAGLDDAAAARVILWIAGRRGVPLAPRVTVSNPSELEPDSMFRDFADLFYRVEPQTNAERALAAAYWLAGTTGDTFTGQAINSLLKDLGFQIPNITDALTQNMRERPALIVQIRKGGSTKQARKQYKLTDAGARRLKEAALRGGA